MPDLQQTTDLVRLLGDITRVRLLALLMVQELTVAELVRITRLPQPRVSTHLGRLRDAGLIRDRRVGSSAYYAPAELSTEVDGLWKALRGALDDPLLEQDSLGLAEVLEGRASASWADSVAGQMARQYFPGRTWENLARTVAGLARLGEVLDIASGDGAVAELCARRARRITCLDASPKMVQLGRSRLSHVSNIRFELGDMHELPFGDRRFDQILMLNALQFADDPAAVLREAARVLVPGGDLVGTTLAQHSHRSALERFGHANLGFSADALRDMLTDAGFDVQMCQRTSRERRPPHFESITFYASTAARERR